MKKADLLGPFARSVLVSIAVAVVLFLSLEAGCRAAGRVNSGRWPVTRAAAYTRFVEKVGSAYRLHPYLGVCGRPNAVLKVEGHEVHFNSLGLRGPEVALPKPPGTFRVICEGGSTTFDLLAPDDAETWPARLGALMKPSGGEVVNAGFPGWTSLESLIALELRDVDLSPDAVVVYSGINDLQPAGHDPFTPDYSRGHGDLMPRVLGVVPVPLPLVSRSVFLELLLDRLRPGAGRIEGFAPAWAWKGGARRADIPDEAVRVYERNLRSTAGVARAHGARTLLVAQTVRYRKGKEAQDREYVESWTPGLTADGYRQGLSRFNAVAKRLGEEEVAAFLDPFASGELSDDDFWDPVHFSARGSEKFARRLATALEALRGAPK